MAQSYKNLPCPVVSSINQYIRDLAKIPVLIQHIFLIRL